VRLPKFSKKVIAIGAAAGLAMGAAGIAAAFFNATGSGTGSATVTTTSNVTLTGTSALSASTTTVAETVAISVSNPNTGHVTLGYVYVSSITAHAGCPAGSFVSTVPSSKSRVPTGASSLSGTELPKITLVTLGTTTPADRQTTCANPISYTLATSQTPPASVQN